MQNTRLQTLAIYSASGPTFSGQSPRLGTNYSVRVLIYTSSVQSCKVGKELVLSSTWSHKTTTPRRQHFFPPFTEKARDKAILARRYSGARQVESWQISRSRATLCLDG